MGGAVLAFALVFGVVFIAGKIVARRIGGATRNSVVGPVDRVLGGGFGALQGLIGATLLFLAANIVYDFFYTRRGSRPDWMLARKIVVLGKRLSYRVVLGCPRIIKKKT